jgi:hypothetical protein
MLDKVDLIDVSPADRLAYSDNCGGVGSLGPGSLPGAERRCLATLRTLVLQLSNVAIRDNVVVLSDDTGKEGKRARLGRRRRVVPTDRLGEPIPEIELCDEPLPTGGEEPVPTQPLLEPAKRAFGLEKLECQRRDGVLPCMQMAARKLYRLPLRLRLRLRHGLQLPPGAVPANERVRRRIVAKLGSDLGGDLAGQPYRQHLAELYAPLVERVDPPDRSLREHAVLVKTDERPE